MIAFGGELAMRERIEFYSVADEFGWMSNFAYYEILIDGRRWPTTEHYFQAQKFEESALRERIRRTKSVDEAARMGRNRKNPLRRDWRSVKDQVMLKAVRTKFAQHPELARALRETGAAKLVEHTERDAYWGDGGDGRGQNRLGKILMQVREELLQKS
jgi:ribA/ribD-fused uncharacterized protein